MITLWIKSHKIKSALLLVVLLLTTIMINNSYITAWGIKYWFEQQGSKVEIEELTLSLWNSSIEIDGVKSKDQQGRILAIKHFSTSWSWNSLWNEKLELKVIKLNGLNLNIESSNGNPKYIGPLNVNKLSSESQPVVDNTVENEPWPIEVGNIEFNNLNLCIKDDTFSYKKLLLPLNKDSEKLNVCLKWEQFHLKTVLSIDSQSRIDFSGDIKLLKVALSHSIDQPLFSLQRLDFSSFSYQSNELTVKSISTHQLKALALKQQSEIADFGLMFESLKLEEVSWDENNNIVQFSQLFVNELNTTLRASDKLIHSALRFKKIAVGSSLFNANDIKVESIKLSGLSALENLTIDKNSDDNPDENGGENTIAFLKQLSLKKLNLVKNRVDVNEIKLDGFNMNLASNETGINIVNWFANEKETDAKSVDNPELVVVQSNQHSELYFKLSKFSISNNSTIKFVDDLGGNKVTHSLADIKLNINDIHIEPDMANKAEVFFSAKVGEQGLLTSNGWVVPLISNPLINLKGELSNVDMVNLTDYTERFTGYRVDSGQLNMNYFFNLENNKIDSNFESLFEKFNLANLEQHEKSELNAELGIPLPMALILLRDNDDNIELEIPVTGDVNEPDFSIASIISTVTFKAIKNAVIYNYSPLGMFSLASGIFDLATALSFNPIVFEYGKSNISDVSKEQLDKVAELMLKKPKVKFLVCAVATVNDWNALNPPKNENEAVLPINMEVIFELANKRQKIVIKYMINSYNIDTTRLLPCNVKLSDDKKAKAIVELSI